MKTGNPAFCLFLYLTGVQFRGELQYDDDAIQQKIKCQPIRTREIGGVSLSDVLYVLEGRDSKSYALLVDFDLTAHRLK